MSQYSKSTLPLNLEDRDGFPAYDARSNHNAKSSRSIASLRMTWSGCTKLAALLGFSILYTTNATAATSFPRGCEVTGYGFVDNDLVLNEKGGQAYYMIQNRSDRKIELEHYNTNPDAFMSPKLENKFDPLRWSAFASDVENMHFRCYTKENDDRMLVNCRDALDVCQYPRAKFALSNMGNYWVSTNKPIEQVVKDTVAKGIYLRW